MMNLELEQENLRKRLLKSSIKTKLIFEGKDIQRDIVLKQGETGLDFDMVTGFDNLTQSLSIALTTRLGADIFNIQFGFDGLNALVEETNPILQKERIRIAVIRVLEKDSRVKRILDVRLSGDKPMILPTPIIDSLQFETQDERESEYLRLSRQLAVYVWFETIAGDQTSISVSRIMNNG
jgi:phage baseplate assembly protein W